MTVDIMLSNKMREYANGRSSDELPNGFLKAANKFDRAIDGFFGDPQTKSGEEVETAFNEALALWKAIQ